MKEATWNPEFGTGGILHCKCDLCEKKVDFKFKAKPDYKGSQAKLKDKGWLARKLGDKWYDFCSDKCFEEFKGDD
jgi:hypothetical protein